MSHQRTYEISYVINLLFLFYTGSSSLVTSEQTDMLILLAAISLLVYVLVSCHE
jgi:hypothetical protein